MEIREFLSHFSGVKKCRTGYIALCPVHGDHNPSLSISLSEDRTKILLNCFCGCDYKEILAAVSLKPSDLFITNNSDGIKKIVKETPYHYYDTDGTLLYTKIRTDYSDGSKKFYFQQPNGTKNAKGVKRVPYNLPAILNADKVYFVEGEKCAEAVIKKGYCATTLDSGSNSGWKEEYNQYFAGKEIIIIPDNDEPGLKYAKNVARHLKNARIISIPEGGTQNE